MDNDTLKGLSLALLNRANEFNALAEVGSDLDVLGGALNEVGEAFDSLNEWTDPL